jgi:hypothetical protein
MAVTVSIYRRYRQARQKKKYICCTIQLFALHIQNVVYK